MSKNDMPNPLIPRWFYLNDANLNVAAWVKAQAEVYTTVSQRLEGNMNKPIRLDKVEVEYKEPDRGWIDTRIYINGEENTFFCLSDWNNPVVDIIEWLEAMVDDPRPWELKDYSFVNDCEREEIVFHVQTLSSNEVNLCIFLVFNSWFDEHDQPMTTSGVAIVKKEDLITAFYRPLVKLFEDMPQYDDEPTNNVWFSIERQKGNGREVIENKYEYLQLIKSEKIEKYLTQYKL